MTSRRSHIREPILSIFAWTACFTVVALLAWILIHQIHEGLAVLSWEFILSAPEGAGRAGGIAPMIVSTIIVVVIAMACALPVALASAVYLCEFVPRGSFRRRTLWAAMDIQAAVPSIVFGLFGNTFFCQILGMGFSLLSGGLTLAAMIVPILTRSAAAGLECHQGDVALAASALGLNRIQRVLHLGLPGAVPAIGAGLLLGIGRAIGETAALIFTSGSVDRMPESIWDSGRTLAVHIFDLSMNIAGGDRVAYGTSLVLILVIVVINGATHRTINRWTMTRTIS